MADISIPGVSDKYKTNDYITALMEKERIPLKREQDTLDQYKAQETAWREVNQKMSTLRDSVKTLYSFDNPFNNKITSSSQENAITADAGREAAFDSIKIDVLQPATADRFLSTEIDKNSTVPQGTYTYTVADKTVTMNWHGGKLGDFVTSLNKRSNGIIKASLVGVTTDKQTLLIESLKTGNGNNLVFKNDALTYALQTDMIKKAKGKTTQFGTILGDFKNPSPSAASDTAQQNMPAVSVQNVSVKNSVITVAPRGGFTLAVPASVAANSNEKIEFSYSTAAVPDITESLNQQTSEPQLPDAGSAGFAGITIQNKQSETTLAPGSAAPAEPLKPIENEVHFYVHNKDGSEQEIDTTNSPADESGQKKVAISVSDHPDIESIIVRNNNTGTAVTVSPFSAYDEKANLGYEAVHPVNTAADAKIKYEGITITRPSNTIDDVIPHVTLHLYDKTDNTATIDIKPDTDSAKDSLIKFVGNYNQVVAKMNILSQNKPEIITELDYLSKDEKDAETKELGMFQGDFSLTNTKASLQSITSGSYHWEDNAPITMLSQIGISTHASETGGGNTPGQLRGYLEIDEKKLDSNLSSNLDAIKNLFGYDSDGDLIIDSGIGYLLDKQLGAWVQTGGIISNKTKTIDTKMKSTQSDITKLQAQLDTKEQQLKEKYGQMEATLNSLGSQSTAITNFSNASSKNQ